MNYLSNGDNAKLTIETNVGHSLPNQIETGKAAVNDPHTGNQLEAPVFSDNDWDDSNVARRPSFLYQRLREGEHPLDRKPFPE